ncbi:MAG: tetratricopeptide repeat protein [Sphingomicrobium sp.]
MTGFTRAFAIGLSGLLLAVPASAQRGDDQILPQSIALENEGKAALAAGKFETAEDLLETALAVDPRNRFAYIDIARVAQRQQLFGKAIKMTNKALELDPNDADAIGVQGEAMAQLGALARAQDNLKKLQTLCGAKACPQIAQLQAAITRGPVVAEAKPGPATTKKN